MIRLFSRLILLTFVSILLNACSSTAPVKREKVSAARSNVVQSRPYQPAQAAPYRPAVYSGTFPKPAALEPAVDFWRKTYGVWQRSEVAFHDDRYLDVVYEVITLPGYVAEGLTQEQKDIVSQRRDYWKAQLAGLESKLRYGGGLTAADKQIIAKLENNGRSVRMKARSDASAPHSHHCS